MGGTATIFIFSRLESISKHSSNEAVNGHLAAKFGTCMSCEMLECHSEMAVG